jgi:outer membrane protein assembly factor BamE
MRLLFKYFLPLFIICGALLAGCGSSAPSIKPFKMDIQQGNVVTSKMLLQLKPGMTKSQVRFIMGTPLIVDSFHKDRWDYFYQMRQAGKIVEQRRVILDFEKELLTKVRGDVVPQGAAGAAVDEAAVASAPITVEPKPKETSMLDKLKFWKKDEKVIAKPEVKPELMTPTVPVEAAAAALPAAVTAVAEEVSPEMVKPEVAASAAVEKSASEKSASEKSWVDKLKFWKKDEQQVAKSLEADAPLVASPTAAAAETTDTAAKVDMSDEATAKSASDKSLLDKLKFWKKDAPVAAVEKEMPSATAPEAASVLAVPIELPSDAATTTAIPKEDAVNAEPLKTEPLRTEPYEATQKPSITGKDSMKPIQSPSQKMLPGKPELLKPMPEKPAVPSSVFNKPPLEKPAPVDSQLSRPLKPLPLSAKKGEQLIFRMDKTLDLERGLAVKPEAMPEPAATTPDAATKPIKAEAQPLPVEAAPSFFDKMLEKIGF